MTELMALGRKWNGDALFAPRREADVVAALGAALEHRIAGIKAARDSLATRIAFRGEVRRKVKDPADPAQAGWCVLHNADDPRAASYLEVMAPLARHRADPGDRPLVFHGEPPEEWLDWLTRQYHRRALDGERAPGFVLILGGPDQVPFGFQSLLHTVASVGRLAPERLEDLQIYVDKVLRLERAAAPAVDREVLFFATDEGPRDPTYFSREYMVKPLAEHVRGLGGGYDVHLLQRDEATKPRLLRALQERRPALVYTASHGLGAVGDPQERQERYNGAICCHHRGPQTLDALFTADDVPGDGAFLEGAVFFQFACYGYGTPARSDYAHWLDTLDERNAARDFVAALPRRLLAHPRGPVAYIGHVDLAFLHGFTDVHNPHLDERWHDRLAPYKRAIDGLLDAVEPAGFAMEAMSERYAAASAVLTNMYDGAQRQQPWTENKKARFLDQWIMRGDAQNFMVMGDPAALLRIPSP